MSEAGHTEGRTVFTAHCHAATCPLPGSPDRRSLGTKVSGWGLAPTCGWRVLSCHPHVVPALLLSLVVILGVYEPLDILIFRFCFNEWFLPLASKGPSGPQLPPRAAGSTAGWRGGTQGRGPKGLGCPSTMLSGAGADLVLGSFSRFSCHWLLLACLVPSGHCRLRSHGCWGDFVYRTELRRHRPPQSEGCSQGPPREA